MNYMATVILVVFAPAFAPAADHPPADHGGSDLILSHGDRIWGEHSNIGRFEVPAGVTVDLHRYYPDIPGSGRLDVYAREIVVAGTLNAEGAGYTGGGGGGAHAASGCCGYYLGADGVSGQPRYPDYPAYRTPWASDGDGPAGGVRQQSLSNASLRHGGYNEQNLNTDTTTDTSVLMGSGGAGAYPTGPRNAEPTCTITPRGGDGGAGGGPGGGAIRLFAEFSLDVTGVIHTMGALAMFGTSGKFGQLHPHDPQGCANSGGDGGNGGNSEALNFGGFNMGSGAGGGVVLHCGQPASLRVTGKVDARSSEWRFGGSQSGLRNGGTIKIFYRGDAPTSGTLRAGRYYFRDIDKSPIDEAWILSEKFPRRPTSEERRVAVARRED